MNPKLPEDWHRRSFCAKLAYIAFEMRRGPRPSASHREWLHALTKDERKLQVILDAGSQFREVGLLASVKGEGTDQLNSWDIAVSEAAVRYHAHERWADYGCQTFQLTESLAAMLALTDATIGYDEVEWPFPALMLEIPVGFVPVPAVEDYRERPVRVLIHDHLRAQGHGPDDTYAEERWLHIEAFLGDCTVASCVINKRASDLATGICSEKLRSYSSMDETGLSQEFITVRDSHSAQQTMQTLLNLCCGFALWLKSTGGTNARTPSNRTTKKRTSKPKLHWPTTWIVGRQVKLDRALRDAAKEAALTQRTNRGWTLQGQQLISGHWKMQAHGPGRSLRKLIHVEPYLRGPESDEAWSRVYKAESEQ